MAIFSIADQRLPTNPQVSWNYKPNKRVKFGNKDEQTMCRRIYALCRGPVDPPSWRPDDYCRLLCQGKEAVDTKRRVLCSDPTFCDQIDLGQWELLNGDVEPKLCAYCKPYDDERQRKHQVRIERELYQSRARQRCDEEARRPETAAERIVRQQLQDQALSSSRKLRS